MNDIKKIQEFFSKPLEENTFKKGDKVTYLGHPAEITSVEDRYGKTYLSVSYDKGKGKTKARGILATTGDVKPLNEMEFGDPVDAVFRKYAGKTIEMDFEDMESDWANLLNDLEEYFPGDKLSDFMDSGEADLYLDDYNITLMEPIMDKEVDLDVLKRAKAKMDIDKMRYDAGMPPMDSIASLNEDEDIDFEYRVVLDKFKDIMKGLDVKEADALQQKLKAYFAGLDENMKKPFTDYTNQELAAYVKNTKDKEAAKELHKRSQKLKNLSRTDVKEDQDINDPVMMKMRAAKDKLAKMRAANAGDDGNDHIFRAAAAKLKKLGALKQKRAEIMRDMEQEAEMEGGPIADRYGDMLNKIDKAIAKLEGHGEWGPERDTDITAQEIAKRVAMMGLEEDQQADHVNPMVAKAYKDYIKAKKDSAADVDFAEDPEKAYRYYSKKLNNTYSTKADRDAIEGILKKKYGSALEEASKEEMDKFAKFQKDLQKTMSTQGWKDLEDRAKEEKKEREARKSKPLNEGTIGDIQSQLDDLGVEYKMSLNPFKVIYKPVNKDDRWYKDFDDIIFRYNLGGVVKTVMDEAKSLIKVGDIVQKSYASTDEDYIKEFKVISIDKKGKATLKDTKTGKLTGMHIGDLHKASMNEATKDEETTFHKKLDKLVHDTFGKRKGELEEAFVPSNIKDFAKRRGVSRLVNTVAGWAEKVGARITGGTAIGYNYNTLILDMGYQTGDIRIDVEDETIELYDEPIYSFADFKRVFMDEVTRNQIEHDEEQLRRERGLEERIAEALDKINEELCPAGKAYIKKRQAAGEKSSAYLSGRAVKVCKGQMKG